MLSKPNEPFLSNILQEIEGSEMRTKMTQNNNKTSLIVVLKQE